MANVNSKDFNYFVANYEWLYNKYGHKFIVIKNQQILGAYETMDFAIDETMKTEPLGTFIVQECSGSSSAYRTSIINLCVS